MLHCIVAMLGNEACFGNLKYTDALLWRLKYGSKNISFCQEMVVLKCNELEWWTMTCEKVELKPNI